MDNRKKVNDLTTYQDIYEEFKKNYKKEKDKENILIHICNISKKFNIYSISNIEKKIKDFFIKHIENILNVILRTWGILLIALILFYTMEESNILILSCYTVKAYLFIVAITYVVNNFLNFISYKFIYNYKRSDILISEKALEKTLSKYNIQNNINVIDKIIKNTDKFDLKEIAFNNLLDSNLSIGIIASIFTTLITYIFSKIDILNEPMENIIEQLKNNINDEAFITFYDIIQFYRDNIFILLFFMSIILILNVFFYLVVNSDRKIYYLYIQCLKQKELNLLLEIENNSSLEEDKKLDSNSEKNKDNNFYNSIQYQVEIEDEDNKIKTYNATVTKINN